jgi:DNA-binding NarL/FixJ family response regulator
VFGAVALAFGEAASFIAFFAGGAALRHGIAAPALSQPGVLQLLSKGVTSPAKDWLAIGSLLALLLILGIAIPRAGRGLGTVHRDLAAGLLGRRITGPSPRRRGHGVFGRPAAMLRDGPGWRAAAYALVKLPVTVAEIYAVALAALGLTDLSYPFWWPLFRNHPAGSHLHPVTVLTPFGGFGVSTFPGTWAAFAAGAAMVLAAPWLARGAAAADCWLMRGMLGPGRLAQRVADLEQTRALAVEDSAAQLRRVERDLHDGAQIRLATLAMNLGMARERFKPDSDPELRELVDAAHQGAKDAVGDADALLEAVAEHDPDVAVVDIRMPPTHTDEGLRAAIELRCEHPGTGVLVLSQYIETRYAARLLEGNAAGAGYLLKDRVADVAEFADALARVAAGGTALDPEVVSQLVRVTRHSRGVATLTPRERDVMSLMAEGRSNAGIAAALVVSGGVVEKHVASIFGKLGLPPSEADNRRVLAVLRYLGS